MKISDKILRFYASLTPNWDLPNDIELLFPFDNEHTWSCVKKFYGKYFNDTGKRRLILGINPGRFGAGITGIPFTDPKILSEDCGIENPFRKKHELSAIFIYEMIDAYGGKEKFYMDYFISSLCPLGFVKNGVNLNYYDDNDLYQAVRNIIVDKLWEQIDIGIERDIAFSLGKGANYKYLTRLNDEQNFFNDIIPLPHPRWVMQYRRKQKDRILEDVVQKLSTPFN